MEQEYQETQTESPQITSLVVIGNGFDLAAGLHSKYCDFLAGHGVAKENELLDDYDNIWYRLLLTYYCKKDCPLFSTAPKSIHGLNWVDIEWFIRHVIAGEADSDVYRLLRRIKEGGFAQNRNYHDSEALRLQNLLGSKETSLNDLLEQRLASLEEDLRNYLISEEKTNQDYGYNCVLLLNAILDEGQRFDKTCVLSFNYTKPDLGVQQHISVHGDLQSGGIIIGIDEHSALGGKEEIRKRATPFTKSYKKMCRRQNPLPLPSPNDVESIYFYGLSLSEQDLAYYRSLFNFYDVYNTTVRLVFCYPKKYLNDPMPESDIRNKMVSSVHRLLSDYVHGINKVADDGSFITRLLLEGRLLLKPVDDVETLRTDRPKSVSHFNNSFLAGFGEPLYHISRLTPPAVKSEQIKRCRNDDEYLRLPVSAFAELLSTAILESRVVFPDLKPHPSVESGDGSILFLDERNRVFRVRNFFLALADWYTVDYPEGQSGGFGPFPTAWKEWNRLLMEGNGYSGLASSIFMKGLLDVLKKADSDESLILFAPFSLGGTHFLRVADEVELLYGAARANLPEHNDLFFVFITDDTVVLCGPSPEKRESFSIAFLTAEKQAIS